MGPEDENKINEEKIKIDEAPAGQEPKEVDTAAEKRFDEYNSYLKRKEAFINSFYQSGMEDADFQKYEQNRKIQKHTLKDLTDMYRAFSDGDKNYDAIIGLLDDLAESNATSGSDFWKEADAYQNTVNGITEYLKTLEQEEEAINLESKEKLTKNGKWIEDEEIFKDKDLLDTSISLSYRQNLLDDKRRALHDIRYYLVAQRDGNLDIEKATDGRHINAVGKKFDTNDYGHKENISTESVDFTNQPLFPHEPNTNDIRQGYFGDCYFLTALSNIARLSPEKIKENIIDNNDGTATVRFFEKSERGKYSPVYVTVNKMQEKNKWGDAVNGVNSVWVDVYERAFIASGLNANYSMVNERWQAVPENIEQIYANLKEKTKDPAYGNQELLADKGKYPWLFTSDEPYKLVEWPNYENSIGGDASAAMEMLMGEGYNRTVQIISQKDLAKERKNKKEDDGYLPTEEKIYGFIDECIKKNIPVAAGSNSDAKLVAGSHAHSVLDAYEENGKKFVRLRNPWGDVSENGIVNKIDSKGNVKAKAGSVKDGIFDVELSEFCRQFYRVAANGYDRDTERIVSNECDRKGIYYRMTDSSQIKKVNYMLMFMRETPLINSERAKKAVAEHLMPNNKTIETSKIMVDDYVDMVQKRQKEIESQQKKDKKNGIQTKLSDEDIEISQIDTKAFKKEMDDEKVSIAYGKIETIIRRYYIGLKNPTDRLPEMNNKDVLNGLLQEFDKQIDDFTGKSATNFEKYLYKIARDNLSDISNQLENGKLIGEQEMEDSFDKLKQKFDGIQNGTVHGKLYLGSPLKVFDPDNEITNVYQNENGERFIDTKDRHRIKFDIVMKEDGISLKDDRPEAFAQLMPPGEPIPDRVINAQPNAPEAENEYIVPKTYRHYMKILNDLDSTLSTSRTFFSKDSQEYKALKDGLKDVRFNVAKMSMSSFDKVAQEMQKLSPLIESYENHCAQNPRKGNAVRNARLNCCQYLKDAISNCQKHVKEPLKQAQLNYSRQLVKLSAQKTGKILTAQQTEVLAHKMLDDRRYHGTIVNKDVYSLNKCTDRDVSKTLEKMQAINAQHARVNEVKKTKEIIEKLENPVRAF